MRFLVVDDDFEARLLMQRLLRPFGEVDVAVDGDECVAAFSLAHKDGEPYSLVLLDILMPNMDGQQALREIREIEGDLGVSPDNRVKVVMVSGLDDAKELHDAFFLGEAASYIVKPVHKEDLLREIARLGLSVAPLEGR
ncbi:MAG: response regulator [Deltaproteobacteria bacterium]|jgi:two-component system chemotaxis response regulator CheY|nr:response regulator [Deltaproteobacteria bacterium]